jgi:GxxExxY protein
MEHEELTYRIIGCAHKVYNQLGFGFLESVYKNAMIIELVKNGLKVEAEKPLKVYYDEQVVGDYFVDLYVEDAVVAELKAVEHLSKQHEVQVVNYLRGLEKDIGLLINFGPSSIEVKRKYRTSKTSTKSDWNLPVSSRSLCRQDGQAGNRQSKKSKKS